MAVIAGTTGAGQRQEKIKPTIYKKTVKALLYSTFHRGFDLLRRGLTELKNILTNLSHSLPWQTTRSQKMSSSK